MTVDKRERDQYGLYNRTVRLNWGLTGCVSHSGINCWIELYGCSLTVPVMCRAFAGGGGGLASHLSRELGKLCRRKFKRAEMR